MKDLFGFIDILCVDEQGITAIQSCGASYAAHMRTITEECRGQVLQWLKVAGLALYAWRKVKLKRGGKAMRWKPRIAHFSLANGHIVVQEEKRSFTV